ncbi:MAG TPA: DAK2 domain-containing protein [Solirubrobacterales bacterium]
MKADASIERFRRVVTTAYGHLDERRREVNDLNVFPVADGDTGDNMALTLQAVIEALASVDGRQVDEVGRQAIVDAVAHAALMGARGNSGVILSQIVSGAAQVLAERKGQLVDPELVRVALMKATATARQAIPNPAPGTMLTVLAEMTDAIEDHIRQMAKIRLEPGASDVEQDALLAELLEVAVEAGHAALDRTPEQLPVLAEHGVVDAGGYGLLLLVAGILAGLRGEAVEVPHYEPPETIPSHHEDSRYRWCSNFVVVGEGIEPQEFVSRLEELGDSVMVVGDRDAVRVHIHTNNREQAKALFVDLGEITQEDHADMWRQIEARDRRLRVSPGRTGVIAVAAGAGMRRLLEGLGAYVVDGGPTLNPSPHELLRGIEDLGADEVIVLPNSGNVILAARQAAELSERPVVVVPTTSQQAALVALVEFEPELDAPQNAERLNAALAEIRTGAVAPAAKPDRKGRFVRGDAVGFEGEEIVAWGGEGSTLAATVKRIADGAEIVTVLQGADARIPLDELPIDLAGGVELEVKRGGQPHYWWLIAAQ